jgi:hypothetical protein
METKTWTGNVSGLILIEAEVAGIEPMVCKDCKIQGEMLNIQHELPLLLAQQVPGEWAVVPVYVGPNIPMRSWPDYLRFEWRIELEVGYSAFEIKVPMDIMNELGDYRKIVLFVVGAWNEANDEP